MGIIIAQTSLFPPAKAEAIAADMNAEDEDWTYVVVHDPKGTGDSFVKIIDEDGEVIGKL